MTTPPSPPWRGRWLILGAAIGAAAYLLAAGSTHVALSGGPVGWSGPVPGKPLTLAPITAAQRESAGISTADFSEVLWATRPGGEVVFGFELHNGGLIPVTVVGLQLRGYPPGVITDLAAGGALVGPGFGQTEPVHAVTIGPAATALVGMTVRTICDPTIREDARMLAGHDTSWLGDATSPVVVHYRALGIGTSQTVSLPMSLLVVMPYRACR